MSGAKGNSKAISGGGYPSIGVDGMAHGHLSPQAVSRSSSANRTTSFSESHITPVDSERYAANTPLGLECDLGRIEKQKEYLKGFAASSADKCAHNDMIALLGALEENRQEDARPLLLALLEHCNIPSFAVRETRAVGGKTTILAHEDVRTGAATPLRERYFDLIPPPLQANPPTIQEIVSQSLIDHPITDYDASGKEIITSTKTTSLASKDAAPQVLTMAIGRFSQEVIHKEDGGVDVRGSKNSNPVSGILGDVNYSCSRWLFDHLRPDLYSLPYRQTAISWTLHHLPKRK